MLVGKTGNKNLHSEAPSLGLWGYSQPFTLTSFHPHVGIVMPILVIVLQMVRMHMKQQKN